MISSKFRKAARGALVAALLAAAPISAGAVTVTGSPPSAVVSVDAGETNSDLLSWIASEFGGGTFDSLLASAIVNYGIVSASGINYGMWLTGYTFDGEADAPLSGSLLGQIALVYFEVVDIVDNVFGVQLASIELRYYLDEGRYFASVADGIEDVTRNVTVVPGPVAGAGIPAVLGLMGYGLWRRRQSMTAA